MRPRLTLQWRPMFHARLTWRSWQLILWRRWSRRWWGVLDRPDNPHHRDWWFGCFELRWFYNIENVVPESGR